MDAFAHCADLVRSGDRDRYLADLYAPEAARPGLLALHAFALETGRVRDRTSEPLPGEIRLQWWRDAIGGDAGGEPVATALNETIARYRLPREPFLRLLEARVFDLYDDPMPSLNDLEGYAGDTESAVFQLGAMILAGGGDPGTAELAGFGGVAKAIAGLAATLPRQALRRQSFLPSDLAARHGLSMEDVFAGRTTDPLKAAVADLVALARSRLASARTEAARLEPRLLPAFLPLAPVELELRRMERPGFDPLRAPSSASPWRRQWAIWRAARRGRI